MTVTRFPVRADGPAERLAGFMAHLRHNGIQAGLSETESSLRALTGITATDREEVRLALKAICVRNHDEHARFDQLFDAYWLNRHRQYQRPQRAPVNSGNSSIVSRKEQAGELARSQDAGHASEPDDDSGKDTSGSGTGKLMASRMSVIERTDFRQFTDPDDMARIMELAESLARKIRDRRSRRRRADLRGAMLDLRRIVRHSVSSDGEPFKLFRRRKPDRPVQLVVLLDVSGSMLVYSRVFLAFLKGLVSADQRTDAFLFHTRLANVSDALRDHDTLRAANRISLLAEGFGGGTRIAGNIARFNDHYASRSVNGRSVVIILSDGYDTDPPEAMDAALNRLKHRGCRIIWLNPLKGWKDYEPVARGMAAAMPYLDLFAEANTLASLAALEPWLERI